ncbi:MAG: hypothetical protein EP344_01570, partial [Bacteroidetes bacterium]
MPYLPGLKYCVLLLCWIFGPYLAHTQDLSPAFSFQQTVEHSYGLQDGLPDVCVNRILLDSEGRLHLAACGNNYASAALQVFEFDGIRAYPSEFRLDHEPTNIIFEEGITPDELIGYYIFLNQNGSLRHAVFRYNGISRATQCFVLPEQTL